MPNYFHRFQAPEIDKSQVLLEQFKNGEYDLDLDENHLFKLRQLAKNRNQDKIAKIINKMGFIGIKQNNLRKEHKQALAEEQNY